MSRRLFLLLVSCIILASCSLNHDNYDDNNANGLPLPSYEIGDLYHNDTIDGIVFFTTSAGAHGLMVSLDEAHLIWCTEPYLSYETGATNPREGWNNTNIVMSNFDLYRFPAIDWTMQKNDWYVHGQIEAKHWYLPSKNEMKYLLTNIEAVNETLRSMGLTTMEDKTYWTSTETGTRAACSARWSPPVILFNDSLKTNVYYVRAIRYF